MCEEAGRRVNMGLLCFVRAHYFASSILTPQGYKSEQRPLHTLTPSRIISHCLLVFFLVPEERERERERERKKERERKRERFWSFRECCFSFPLDA
jgi:hypothetical protein